MRSSFVHAKSTCTCSEKQSEKDGAKPPTKMPYPVIVLLLTPKIENPGLLTRSGNRPLAGPLSRLHGNKLSLRSSRQGGWLMNRARMLLSRIGLPSFDRLKHQVIGGEQGRKGYFSPI